MSLSDDTKNRLAYALASAAAAAELAAEIDSASPSQIVLASGNLLVGNANNLAASVAITGDVAIDNAGNASINLVKVASNNANFDKTTNNTQTLLASAARARTVVIVATPSENFAAGNGAASTFSIGSGNNATFFAATGVFASANTLQSFARSGVLASGNNLTVTGTAATGTGTGGLQIAVLALG